MDSLRQDATSHQDVPHLGVPGLLPPPQACGPSWLSQAQGVPQLCALLPWEDAVLLLQGLQQFPGTLGRQPPATLSQPAPGLLLQPTLGARRHP